MGEVLLEEEVENCILSAEVVHEYQQEERGGGEEEEERGTSYPLDPCPAVRLNV